MNRPVAFAVAAVVLFAGAAFAADYSITVGVGESTVVELPGVTAAYALDPSIADASPARGAVTLIGRAGGTTQVVVVTATGTRTIAVTVRPRAQSARTT